MRIIGLHGKAGAGKDTVCDYIMEWATDDGVTVGRREGFADRLKVSAAAALGYTGDNPIGFCNDFKVNGELGIDLPDQHTRWISGRQFLQWYGTEAHRDVFDPDFWIDSVFEAPEAKACDLLVITDVRFPNEAGAIIDRGGEVWEILRPGRGVDEHASEIPLSDELVEVRIYNEGTRDDLRNTTRVMLTGRWWFEGTVLFGGQALPK